MMSGRWQLACLFSLALFGAGAASAAPPVWRIHGAHGAEITLFGSSPNAPLEGGWRTPAFDTALAQADDIWFESPDKPGPLTTLRLFGIISMQGSLPQGETLSPLLSPEGRARLKRLEVRLGVPAARIEPLQPWWADLTLTFAFGEKMKDKDRNGVERYVKAHMARGVRMHAFDTVVHDLQALAASPRDEQIADLEFAMSRREQGIDTLEPDLADWQAGDLARIEREVVQPFRARAPKSYGPFVVERHRLWADEIGRLTGGDRKVLVVVGITNLVGPDSLPTVLRRRGIAVEGP